MLFNDLPMLFPAAGGGGGGGGGGLGFTQVGVVAKTSTASNITFTVPTGGIPEGALIILTYFFRDSGPSAATFSGAVDSKGSLYSLAVEKRGSTGTSIGIAYKANASSLAAGNTITISANHQADLFLVSIAYATAMVTGLPLDKTASSLGTSGNPSASTAATAQASELVVGAVIMSTSPSFTEAAGYISDGNVTGDGGRVRTAHKFVLATGVQTYNPSLGFNSGWVEAMATFKAA